MTLIKLMFACTMLIISICAWLCLYKTRHYKYYYIRAGIKKLNLIIGVNAIFCLIMVIRDLKKEDYIDLGIFESAFLVWVGCLVWYWYMIYRESRRCGQESGPIDDNRGSHKSERASIYHSN
jgi:hypothetical protein